MLSLKILEKIRPKGLRILFVSTEAEPFAVVGGLGVVMHALSKALAQRGHDVRMMIPRYLKINDEEWGLKMERSNLLVPTENQEGPKELICNVKRYDADPDKGIVTTYFLENMEYYEQRANVYGYADDAIRWVLFCRGTLEFLKTSEWIPQVIVCTDWQTGLLADILKTFYRDDSKLSKIATVLSIHNLASQGSFNYKFVSTEEIDDGYSFIPAFEDPKLLKINGMRRAIISADVVNTVSSTYAQEIMTPPYGEGLDELLRKRKDAVVGILNGLDYEIWNPREDKALKYRFTEATLDVRAKNKAVLQEHFALPVSDDYFVVAIVARMDAQKGIDLLEPIIQNLLQDLQMQLVVVGEGEARLMEIFLNMKILFPERVGAKFAYDGALPHLIFAGADVALIPSRFEPSGLTQMEAMAYGCIPIVRKTGGLADTVEDFNPATGTGTGFVFDKVDPLSILIAITRAYESFRHRQQWRQLQKRAMHKDLSWTNSAKQYEELFRKAIELHSKNQTG